jgi:signal transduction histidine kinase/ActR/RegA family two-component response regulator
MSDQGYEELARAHARTRADLDRVTRELRELIGIGLRLAAEHDRDKLLDQILTTARDVTWSDAGSLYLVEADGAGARLRFVLAQNDTLPVQLEARTLPIGPGSVAGYAALSGEVVNLADAYAPPPGSPFTVDASIDRQTGYRTKSILAVPMTTPSGAVIGVLELLNRHPARDHRFESVEAIEREAGPFTARAQDLVTALAAQGAVALENSRLYAELRAAARTVEESQQRVIQSERLRALGEMAGGVAHDFNNVLAVVIGRAQLLLRQAHDVDVRRQLEIIEQVAQDGAQTVRRIQEFARMRRTRPFQLVDLAEVAREAVEAARPRWSDQAQERGVTYDVRLELGAVPPVIGDPAELRESLLNLLFNALDAMPSGGRVSFATASEAGRVVCTVTDEGVGMSEEVRRRCFEPYFTTKREHGSGLGLSIAYGTVTRHGGAIEVASRPGHGTRFTVRLPAAPGRDGEAPAGAAGRRARILVVEDELAVREILADLLTAQGHQVVACEDGPTALGQLAETAFDLVLMDLSMPGLSGWEVARRVRVSHPRVPIALVTGWGDQIELAAARARGIDYVMAKPFDVDELARMVAIALARAGAGGAPEARAGS